MRKRLKMFVALCAFFLLGALGGLQRVQAQGQFCPGEDYCFTDSGCSACKNNLCMSGSCPDPGEQGSNCYVCAG